VVVLGLAVGLAVEAVVDGDLAVAVAPQQGDEVDAPDRRAVLAGPVVRDQADLLGVGLVERRVVEDQGAAGRLDGGLGLVPERIGIGLQPLEQGLKESWAGAVGVRGCTRAASEQLTRPWEATRNWM